VSVTTAEPIRAVAKFFFESDRKFFVKGVTKPSADLKNANPASPFSKPFSTTYANEVTSTPVVNINGATVVVQRYKVTFNIEGQGDVDPDLVCSM